MTFTPEQKSALAGEGVRRALSARFEDEALLSRAEVSRVVEAATRLGIELPAYFRGTLLLSRAPCPARPRSRVRPMPFRMAAPVVATTVHETMSGLLERRPVLRRPDLDRLG